MASDTISSAICSEFLGSSTNAAWMLSQRERILELSLEEKSGAADSSLAGGTPESGSFADSRAASRTVAWLEAGYSAVSVCARTAAVALGCDSCWFVLPLSVMLSLRFLYILAGRAVPQTGFDSG